MNTLSIIWIKLEIGKVEERDRVHTFKHVERHLAIVSNGSIVKGQLTVNTTNLCLLNQLVLINLLSIFVNLEQKQALR
jgi:hypothetical protein